MRIFFIQYLKDFKSYFAHFNAYVILAIYSILSVFTTLYLGDYFLRETYIFNAYFILQPIILMLTIPAVTMRTWSEEIKNGTLELILTQPISFTQLVFAKFCASYTFFLLMILFSLPLLFFTNKFSILDNGAVLCGYAGILLCGALFTAIGNLLSAVNKNIILSYILTIFTILILLQFQFSSFNFSDSFFPLNHLNFQDNYGSFLTGVIYWRDIFYFICAICLLLWLTVVIISQKKYNNSYIKKRLGAFGLILFFIFVSLILGIGYTFNIPMDFTDEHKFSLADSSKKFLASTDKRVNITLYEAKQKREDVNSVYAIYAHFIERFLKLIENSSHGAIRSEFALVDAFSPEERQLRRLNIPFIEDKLGNKTFLYAAVSDNDGHSALIRSFHSLRQNLLEADLMRIIRRFDLPKRNIAIFTSALDKQQMTAFNSALNEFYNVTYFDELLNFIPNLYSIAIVINPSSLSYEHLLAMDQYVLNGGNLIVFCDPQYAHTQDEFIMQDFLDNFGIKLDVGHIIEIETTDDSYMGGAIPPKNKKWNGIRSVLVNKAGQLEVSSSSLYKTRPILTFNQKNMAALSTGKFVSKYLNLAIDTPEIHAVSQKEGKVFFFYDTDLLKDYLYVSEESAGKSFYEIIPFADNMIFLLRVLSLATDGTIEQELPYKHYILNTSSIGSAIFRSIKDRYLKQITTLQKQLDNYLNQKDDVKNIILSQGFSSMQKIGNMTDVVQRIEEMQDELNKYNTLMQNDYLFIVSFFTILLVFIFPGVQLLIIIFVVYIFTKIKSNKIRRFIQNASQTN